MTRKPNRSVAEAGVPVLLPALAPLVDVDAAVEEDVLMGELGFGRGDVPVEDMAAWEQRVPLLRGGTGHEQAPLKPQALYSHPNMKMVKASTQL